MDFSITKKRLTLKIHCPPGRQYKSYDFLEVLEQFISLSSIEAFGPMRKHNVWFLTVTNQQSFDALYHKDLTIKLDGERLKCHVDAFIQPSVLFRVYWALPWFSNVDISSVLSRYGRIIYLHDQTNSIPAIKHVKTGVKIVRMEGDGTKLPYFIEVNNHKLFLSVQGRPPVCFRCLQPNHIRADCDRYQCESCSKFFRRSEAHVCDVSSYAAKTKPSPTSSSVTPARESPPKVPATEIPAVPPSSDASISTSISPHASTASLSPPTAPPDAPMHLELEDPPPTQSQDTTCTSPDLITPLTDEPSPSDENTVPDTLSNSVSILDTPTPATSLMEITPLSDTPSPSDDIPNLDTPQQLISPMEVTLRTLKRGASHAFPGDTKKAALLAIKNRFDPLVLPDEPKMRNEEPSVD
jgi:hypothetical protein